jgi:hypothetical protein
MEGQGAHKNGVRKDKQADHEMSDEPATKEREKKSSHNYYIAGLWSINKRR